MRAKRRRKPGQSGQSVVEYCFLLVLLATIGVAVVVMAGNQLKTTFNDVSFEFNHLSDTTLFGSPTCPDGTPAILRGHQYKCSGQTN